MNGKDHPERRSMGIRRDLPDPITWENDLPFKILSIDGGGIRGIFPAAILAFLEQECLDGQTIGDYFDLIAGTSTGGILALGLGAGLTASEMLQMYLEEGHRVFPSNKGGLGGRARRWVSTQYDRGALDELLSKRLGDRVLRDSKHRLLVPSTEGRTGEVWIFKTPHHPAYVLDGDQRMSSVAAATSAAPTYFEPFGDRGYTFLDGGIWANNPTMVAVVEALSHFTIEREQVRVLSLGCGQKQFRVTVDQAGRAGKIQWRNIIDVAMHFQSVTAVNQAGLLIGRDRVTRLDRADVSDPIGLDEWAKARDILPEEARETAGANEDHLARTYLSSPAPPYVPLV